MKRRTDVHLKEPRFEVSIQNNIIAKEFIAIVKIGKVAGGGGNDGIFSANQSLYHDFFNFTPKLFHIFSLFEEMTPKGFECPG